MRHSKLILAGLLLVTTSIHSCSKSNFAGSNGSLLPTKKSTSATGGDPPMVEAEGGACVPGPETLAFNETPTGVLADKMDLTSSLQTGQDGRAPLQLFVGKSLADNQKVYLDSSSGLAIFRVYQGRTEGSMACGVLSNDGLHGFYLEFKDASGAAIIVANQNFSISKYPTGVSVPIGAVSAWLGVIEIRIATTSTMRALGRPIAVQLTDVHSRSVSLSTRFANKVKFSHPIRIGQQFPGNISLTI